MQILALCSYSPTRQVAAREALDAILACAALGQQVTVLFCGDGVGQVLAAQADYTGSDKPLTRALSALPLYDVEQVYADAQSLQERGLHDAELLPGVTVLRAEAVHALLRDCDRIMSF